MAQIAAQAGRGLAVAGAERVVGLAKGDAAFQIQLRRGRGDRMDAEADRFRPAIGPAGEFVPFMAPRNPYNVFYYI